MEWLMFQMGGVGPATGQGKTFFLDIFLKKFNLQSIDTKMNQGDYLKFLILI